MSVFCFIDQISEVKKNESLTAFFTLKGTEEFLKDHFESFPVMPGVLQVEAVKQAAIRLLELSGIGKRFRLSEVENVRFGQFVKPHSRLKIWVRIVRQTEEVKVFEGRIDLMDQEIIKGRALVVDLTMVPAVS